MDREFSLMQAQSKASNKNATKRSQKRKPKARAQTQFQTVSAPAAMGSTVRTRAPRIRAINGKGVGFRVTHKELVSSVLGSVDFAASKVAINPGLQSSFPWLSSIANNFESYRFRTLRFKYIPNCPTTTVGSSYLCVDYDAADPTPTSETQIVSWEDTVSEPAWRQMTFSASSASLNKRKTYYVRNGALSSNLDIDLYDVGNLFVCTQDNVAAAKLGKVWAEYDVELLTPQLGTVGIGNALYGKVSGADDFATTPTAAGNFPITASVAAGVCTVTSSQQYQCLLAFDIDGTGITACTLGGTATRTNGSQSANAGGTQLSGTATINFSSPGQTVTFDNTATTITAFALRFGQYAVSIS